MSSYKFLPSLLFCHLFTFLFFDRNLVMADTALIEKVCKQQADYQFCISTFNSDSRSATADLLNLGKLSIQFTVILVEDTLKDTLPQIRRNIGDEIGLQRLNVCQSDYEAASQKFGEAIHSMENRAYWDVIKYVGDGTNLIIDCQNIYRSGEPITESPIAPINTRVFNLAGIILTVNDMLTAP